MRPRRGWEEIRAALLERIDRRDWLPGALIPTEAELAAEFGCARATVNRAMRDLAEAGVIERRRRAGTRVATHPVRHARLAIPVTRLEVEGRGQRYSFRLLDYSRAAPPPALAGRLGLTGGAELLHLRSLHFGDGQPFLYEDRWLNPRALPLPLPADLQAISINEWLVQNVAYTAGDISFSAANADAEEAAHLAVSPGAALFVVERATFAGPCAITAVRLLYRPDYRIHTAL